MDEEVDPDDENVNSVLAQEFSELLMILRCQSPTVITELGQMMPTDVRWNIHHSAPSAEVLTEHIKAMLTYFTKASAAECCNFLQSVCLNCLDMPLRLETRLLSVAGYANSKYKMMLEMLISELLLGFMIYTGFLQSSLEVPFVVN